MPTASGKAALMWKSILNSWGRVLIFNISKCKNRRQLVLRAVRIFVYLHLQFTVWHITKNLSDCSEVLPCTYLAIYFSVPERIIKHIQVIQVQLFVGRLNFQSPEIELNHCSQSRSLCRNSFGGNAGIDSTEPLEYCQAEQACRPCCVIELMSMCGDKWSYSISSLRNVALMNRTNFHQIKIHLDEA